MPLAWRLLTFFPLYVATTVFALFYLMLQRGVRAARCAGAGASRCKQVMVYPGGRKVVFGDSIQLLLNCWKPPSSTERSVNICLSLGEAAEPVVVLKSPGMDNEELMALSSKHEQVQAAFSSAYLTHQSEISRQLLFAWTLGLHCAASCLRRVGGQMPLIRAAAVVLPVMPSCGSLLLTRRAASGGAYNSMWVFPGGAVDHQETVEEAAARELAEETGLQVSPGTLRFLGAFQARNEALCLSYLMLIYTADAVGTLKLQRKEVSQAAFLTRETVTNILAGNLDGQVKGVVHGAEDGTLVDQPVPLRNLRIAKDWGLRTGPGTGAGHWFAMQQWLRSRP